MSSSEENVATEEKLGNTKGGIFKLVAPSYEFSLGLCLPHSHLCHQQWAWQPWNIIS